MGSLVTPHVLCSVIPILFERRWSMARKPTQPVQLKLRFPEKLRARIEAAALKNGQSMNSEIVQRLEQSFERANTHDLIQSTATFAASSAVRELFPSDP